MMQIVYFRKGRDGDPITRYEGKIAFPDRRTPVELGEPYVVEEARSNPKGTVYFLRVRELDLEAIARKGEGVEHLEYSPFRGGEAVEVETPKGLCRASMNSEMVMTELYPWGKAYETRWLEPPVEALPGIEVVRLKVALAPDGEEPRWALAAPRIREPERFPVLEEKPDPEGLAAYQERLAAPLRREQESFRVGSVRVALPPIEGQVVAGVRVTGWCNPYDMNPTPCDSVWVPIERTVEPNLHEWRALLHRVQRYSTREEVTAHYGSETWGTGNYAWVEKERHTYVLEHLQTGQILTLNLPHALKGVQMAPPDDQARLTPEMWASGLRQVAVNYLPMEKDPVLQVESPLGPVELAPRVEGERLLVPHDGHPPYWQAAGEGATVTWHARVETPLGDGVAHLAGKLAFREGQMIVEEPNFSILELDRPPPPERVDEVRPGFEPSLLRLRDETVTYWAVLPPQELEVRAKDPTGQDMRFTYTVEAPSRPDPDGVFSVRVRWEGVYERNLEEFELAGRETRHDLEGLRGTGFGGERNYVWVSDEVAVLRHKESGEIVRIAADLLPREFLERGGREEVGGRER